MIHRTFYMIYPDLMHADLPRIYNTYVYVCNRFILGQNGVFVTKNSNGMLMTSGTLHSPCAIHHVISLSSGCTGVFLGRFAAPLAKRERSLTISQELANLILLI